MMKKDIKNFLPEMCNRYALHGKKPIGEPSGFGEVWAAQDTWLGREVAIKISNADLSGEILLCRDIEGHTVRIFDYFRGENDWNAYAMELLESPWITLSQFIREHRYKPNDIQHYFDCFEIAKHILLGLIDIHGQPYKRQNRYVHADIKPDNLFLFCKPKKRDNSVFRMPEYEQIIKIIDLGIAVEQGEENRYGTAAYDYPKSLKERLGHDLYALGIVFLEMLGGELPLHAVMERKDRIEKAVTSTSSGSVYIDDLTVEFISKCARAATHSTINTRKLIDMLDDKLFYLDAASLLALRAINREQQGGLKKDELAEFLFYRLSQYSGWVNKTQTRLDVLKSFVTDMYQQGILLRDGHAYFVR